MLERVPDESRPGRPKYVLTPKGRELAPALLILFVRRMVGESEVYVATKKAEKEPNSPCC